MATYVYRGIYLSGIDITLAEESGDFNFDGGGSIERRYVITVDDSAFFTGTTQSETPEEIYADILYTNDVLSNPNWVPDRVYYGLNSQGWANSSAHPTSTMPLFVAACYKSWANTVRAKTTNFHKYLPVIAHSRSVSERVLNNAFGTLYSGGSVSFITPIGMPYSVSLGNYVCTSYSLRWISGALHVSLSYTPGILIPNTSSVVEMTVSAQRYPSFYGYNPVTEQVELNVVQYGADGQVAELPDAYQGEWRWTITTFDILPLGQMASYVGKINSLPMPIMSANGFSPANYPGGVLCDGYSHAFVPVVGYSNWSIPIYDSGGAITGYTPVGYNFLALTLRTARLTFVGYDQTMLSLDAGFKRSLFYTDPETGGVPQDATIGNGIKNVYCGVPMNFTSLM